ncbi:MAG: type II secretion system protein GspC [Pseudomonadota bacterium]
MYAGFESSLPVSDIPEGKPALTMSAATVTRSAEYSGHVSDVIVQRNLFQVETGSAQDKKAAAQEKIQDQDVESLEKTSLNVKLWGTVTGMNSKSWAVIEDNSTRKQGLYRPGDTLQGAVIKAVLRQRVVLTLNGKDQVLEMVMRNESRGPLQLAQPVPVAAETQSEPDSIVIDRTAIVESTSDINNLMKQVRIRPHFSQGKPDGLLVYGIQPDSLFQQMGLRNGDIITGVDGKEIQSVDDALNLYKNLKNASDVSMQIKRRGNTKEISYHVQP